MKALLTTTVIFDGKNYELWERAVTTALKAKKSWDSLKELSKNQFQMMVKISLSYKP